MNEPTTKLDSLLAQARDILLEWNRNALQAEDDEREQADIIYTLAKQTEDIRRRARDTADRSLHTYQEDKRIVSTSTAVERKQQIVESTQQSKREYPKYLRRGDDALVKVGLRRNKKSEYKQIVPAQAYQRFREIVTKISRNGDAFTAEDLLREFDIDGLSPSYHMYAVLSLLLQKKVVVEVRRGRYKLSNNSVDKAMKSIWGSLPEEAYE